MHSIGNGNRSVVYDGKIAGLYDLEETLGSGHFAVVKLARHVFTGEKVAVKVIDKTKLDEVSRAHLFQEVRCMKLVQHPNVVRLYEVIDTQTKLYLILELGDGGDLYDYIMKHEGGLTENLAREYFRQIVRAISYCHQLHVVHRDLKPENVVFFEKLGVVKLTDFGFSNKFCPGQKLETSCGSLAYSAPEILLGDSYDAPAVDIWSLGVILYMLVCGQPPFEKANDSETLTMIMDCKYTMPSHVSPGCRRLISMMLVREPEKRANLTQIAADSWLQQGAQQEIIPEYLPLVSRQQVSDDDHTLIINKMVAGNIATKEEILEALDRNEYNHITATYFLLAERKLRQQRQEQIQKRRPELSLPVSSSSRLSPRTRVQQGGVMRDVKSGEPNNHLLVPTNNQLCTPRTPGAEIAAGGRNRKCSIVQEEDDEDEISGCTGRDELETPLNRRGSRSEGRINIAIQDRVECERYKKEKEIATAKLEESSKSQNKPKGLENICGIKIINKDTNNVRLRLGVAGGNNNFSLSSAASNRIPIEKRFEKNLTFPDSKPSEPFNSSSVSTTNSSTGTEKRKYSVDQMKSNKDSDMIQTKVLTDSSTIQIPITTTTFMNQDSNMIPKYKTMPSPTRPTIVLSGPGVRPLNEIFEEGTDVGSSDTSATTTPRPIARSTQFTCRTSSGPTPQRKTKFHKTRTPSCSSSDASDDDSESRKKRVHKVVDVSKPLQSQRRDSHDDSSDSQDQGTAPSSSGGANTTSYLVSVNTNKTSSNQDSSGQTSTQNESSTTSNTQNSNSSSSVINGEGDEKGYCDKTEQQQQPNTHYRRHRAGRKRAGETRLRESQSLNRITEVQETTELPPTTVTNHHHHHQQSHHQQQQQFSPTSETQEDLNDYSQRHNNNNNNTNSSKINNINNNCINGSATSFTTTSFSTPTVITKPKGLSARLFQGFIKKNDFVQTQQAVTTSATPSTPEVINSKTNNFQKQQQIQNSGEKNNKLMIGGIDLGKALHVATTCNTGGDSNTTTTTASTTMPTNTKNSSTTKKLKMLGRYFQVHKRICIPLPGLFQKGRLYKAQSCGSLVRDKVNSATEQQGNTTSENITAMASTTSDSTMMVNSYHHEIPPSNTDTITTTTSTTTHTPTTRHSAVLFADKGNILRSCLGVKFLGNSDGDNNENQNNNNNHHHKFLMMKSNTTTTTATALGMKMKNSSTSSLNYLKRNSVSSDTGCYSSSFSDGGAVAAAAVSLLQQFCSSIPTSSPTTPINTAEDIIIPSSVSSESQSEQEQLSSASKHINQNGDNVDLNNDDNEINNKNLTQTSSLHKINEIPLCSSKC